MSPHALPLQVTFRLFHLHPHPPSDCRHLRFSLHADIARLTNLRIIVIVVGCCLYGDGICFANVAFLQLIPRHLWMDLYETNTWCISIGNITLRRAQSENRKWRPKTTYFSQLHNSVPTLSANFCSVELDIDDWGMALVTTKGLLRWLIISWTYVN